MNSLEKILRILKGGLSQTLYATLKIGIQAYGVAVTKATKKAAVAIYYDAENEEDVDVRINQIEFKAINPLRELLEENTEAIIDAWKIERTECYYYLSGRNETTYIEMTFWYNQYTREQKQSQRKHSCLDKERIDRPDWARGITKENKSLNYN